MFGVDQRFGKHCGYHFQGGYEMGRVLGALDRAGSEWRHSGDKLSHRLFKHHPVIVYGRVK
jgi:hypothetical protein